MLREPFTLTVFGAGLLFAIAGRRKLMKRA